MKPERLAELIGSEDSELRRQAVARAAGISGEYAVDVLFQGLGDVDWRVRKEAVHAFSMRPAEPDLIRRLVKAFGNSDDIGLRNAAAEAAGRQGAPAVAVISEALAELDADGRKLAVEALALTQEAAALDLLAKLGLDPDTNVRAAALEAIAEVGRAAPEKAAELLDAALEDTDAFLKLVALDAIRRLGLAPSWDRLKRLLQDPLMALTGLELAAQLGEPEAAVSFVQELERARGQGRTRALRHLAQFIESSEAAALAARWELPALSERTVERLLQLCQRDVEPQLCCDALIVLAAAGNPRVAPLALDCSSDDRLTATAHRALSLLDRIALDALVERLNFEDVFERATAIELLARLADNPKDRERIVEALLPLGEDAVPVVARAWTIAMVQLEDPGGLKQALDWITDAAPAHLVRTARIAARTLAKVYPQEARAAAAEVQPDDERAAWVCVFIGAINSPLFADAAQDTAFLTAAISNASAVARVAALEALAHRPSRDAFDDVVLALNDEVQEVQLVALHALGRLKDERGVPLGTAHILRLAESGKDPALVTAALGALGEARDPSVLPALCKWAADPLEWKAAAAVEALGVFEPAQGREALHGALTHAEAEVVKTALTVLANQGQATEAVITRCLEHPAWDVRRVAVDLLGGRPSRNVREALSKRLSEEQEPAVTDAIVRILGNFEPPTQLKTIPPPGLKSIPPSSRDPSST